MSSTKRNSKPSPQLLFGSTFKAACSKTPLPNSIESLSMTNVVLLSTHSRSQSQTFRHGLYSRGVTPPKLRTHDKLARHSHEATKRQFTHYRVRCGPSKPGLIPDGKFLLFGTNNIIRAGKHNHADAVAATLRLIRCLKKEGVVHAAAHPSAISCPNTVVTGRSRIKINTAKLQSHWRSHHSTRFPGVAINITDGSIVPEVYPTDSRYIMPGVVEPNQLHAGATHLATTLEECKL